MRSAALAQTRSARFKTFDAQIQGQSIGSAAADQTEAQTMTVLAKEAQSGLESHGAGRWYDLDRRSGIAGERGRRVRPTLVATGRRGAHGEGIHPHIGAGPALSQFGSGFRSAGSVLPNSTEAGAAGR